MILVGLSGSAGSGKGSVAEFLQEKYNFKILSFAEPLKRACMILFKLSHWQVYTQEGKFTLDERWGKTPREILQFVGTDLFRNHYSKDFWIRRMRLELDEYRDTAERIVIDDIRFDNEAGLTKEFEGYVINLVRPDNPFDLEENHASEQDIPLGNIQVPNKNGRLSDTLSIVNTVVKSKYWKELAEINPDWEKLT